MGSVPAVVGRRYRVERELGHGGMARVYHVVDLRCERQLALKQLVVQGPRRATLQAMFEREYHTLVQLAHPRIVSVFDYGLGEDGPYYTLELLQGCDFRQAARGNPLDVRESCLLLRDAASALSLVHSRRMVHRDLSTRNLWRTHEGRAKLIDFGTLVTMGSQTRPAGTPPFVPPEAVFNQPLDARCDVYGLGATAYYLLTGRHAYPARAISQLRQQWQQRPEQPIALRPELPRALSELVMAMLSLDARGRPASAGEVYERLTAIGELQAEDEQHLAQAFLASPTLAGRDEAARALREQLLRAVAGDGSAAALVAPSGMGRSRMLSAVVLDAKVMGAATVAIDAAATGAAPLSLATALTERLVETLPATATASAEVAGVLSHLSPELHRAMGSPALIELESFGRVRRLSSALLALVEATSRRKPLVIAVDDAHRADAASLGILARLSLLTDEHRLLLLTSCDEGALSQPPAALQQLVEASVRIALPPLRQAHLKQLLGSLFGGVSGLDEAASWLHELSQGSPQACMQYAQYLVDRRLARFEHGQWRLPSQLRSHGLPATLASMLESRLAELGHDARTLALGLALARDDTRSSWQPENHVYIEDFPTLIDGAGDSRSAAARAFLALDELVRAGIVAQRDDSYTVSQRAMVDVLLRNASREARRKAHARLADIFEQESYRDRMLTVRQRQLAGDDARACQLLVAYSEQWGHGAMDWDGMRVMLTVECAQKALAYWQSQDGSPRAGILLRRQLLIHCAAYDWSIVGWADDQLAQLCADCGIPTPGAVDDSAASPHAVAARHERAQREFAQKPAHERGFSPAEAVRELAITALPLAGALVYSHDLPRSRWLRRLFEGLRPLSPLLDLAADLASLADERVRGLSLGDRLRDSSNRLFETRELTDLLRVGGSAAYLYGQAMADARRGRKRALELMDRLALTAGEDLFFVLHARWLGYAFRGHSALAEDLRKHVEVIGEDDVWRRKAFLHVEAQLHALTGDLPALHRAAEAIAELAARFAGWRPWADWARAEIHRVRGELPSAEQALSRALAQARAGEHCAFVVAAPAYAELLLLQDRAQDALRETRAIMDAVATHGLDRSAAVAAGRVQALALSRLGRHEEAADSHAAALALALDLGYDGLPLAQLYQARARIALEAADGAQCVTALASLRRLLQHADAPALVGAYEATREESSRRLGLSDMPPRVSPSRVTLSEPIKLIAQVRAQLDEAGERSERARRALQLLLDETGAAAGHLFLLDVGGVYAAASHGGQASDALRQQAQHSLELELGQARRAGDTTDAETAASSQGSALLTHAEGELVPVLLQDTAGSYSMLVGLALLSADYPPLRTPRSELLRAISSCLLAAGDTVPLALGE